VEVSDNGAANLLLRRVGGPQALTGFFRANGDAVTRLDRYELELNENRPGDPRDTTTPAAMAGLVLNLLAGDRLPAAGRAMLFGWMRSASTGLDRLRAGFPAGWAAGDKTGTGNGANHDVAVAYPPGRAPLVVASYIDARGLENPRKNATHAAVARIVAASVG
jgi:beta-lactamase class A